MARKAYGILGCHQVEGGDPSPLLGTGEATTGGLCRVLGSLAQERYGANGKSLVMGHKDDNQPGEEKVQWDLIIVYTHLN